MILEITNPIIYFCKNGKNILSLYLDEYYRETQEIWTIDATRAKLMLDTSARYDYYLDSLSL